MVSTKAMVRIVACLAYLREQGSNFAGNNALILQSPDEIDLLFIQRCE